VCAAGQAQPAGRSFQPSSAAVAAVHADADTTEIQLASRLLSTGYTVVQAAASYAATDHANSSVISGIIDEAAA
jgi:hypothetical protein